MRIQLARFIADYGDSQAVPRLEVADEIDHLCEEFRLREHKSPKLGPGKRSFFVEDHAVQIFLERNPVFLVGGKVQYMPFFHFGIIQVEVPGRPSAGMMIPTVGEQDAADIHKQRRDLIFHWVAFAISDVALFS
jgi:hypothetical protein